MNGLSGRVGGAACTVAIAWGNSQGHGTGLATGGRMGASLALVA